MDTLEAIAVIIDPYFGHEYVDLGLPSGLKWATCNIGANSPEEYGDYFAWGETAPKESYTWGNYKFGDYHCNKYNASDGKVTLELDDDAASANWGGTWRTPSKADFEELINNTTCTSTKRSGVSGYLFTASSGGELFLPAAGESLESLFQTDELGYYWSSSLSSMWDCAVSLYFDYAETQYETSGASRFIGRPVRPVSK